MKSLIFLFLACTCDLHGAIERQLGWSIQNSFFRVDTSSDEAKTEGQIALLWLRAMATSDPDYVELIYDAFLPHNIEVFQFGQTE